MISVAYNQLTPTSKPVTSNLGPSEIFDFNDTQVIVHPFSD